MGSIIKIAHSTLNEQQIDLKFTSFKNDGTYGKAKHPLPGVWFAFAEVSDRTWVELEIKSRQSKGVKYSQDSLYSFLKENYKCSTVSNKYRITWNQEDIETSPRNPQGLDIRIKIYLNNQKMKFGLKP